MKYTPNANPAFLGLWELDGTESVAELGAAILAERQRRAERQGRPLLRHESALPKLELFRMPPAFKAPRPGTGDLVPGKLVAAAMELCERHGAEFWALAPRGRVWGVQDGRYVEVDKYGCREVDGRTGEPPLRPVPVPSPVPFGAAA